MSTREWHWHTSPISKGVRVIPVTEFITCGMEVVLNHAWQFLKCLKITDLNCEFSNNFLIVPAAPYIYDSVRNTQIPSDTCFCY